MGFKSFHKVVEEGKLWKQKRNPILWVPLMSPTVRNRTLTLYNLEMLEVTNELAEARIWAATFLGSKNAAKYYMSRQNFVAAYNVESSFSFIVKGEPFYGQLYGVNPYVDPRCTEVAILGKLESENFVVRGGGFQFWEAVTTESGSPIEILRDAAEINQMIGEHAPDSSVRPGDPEEVFWGGIRDQEGELVACALQISRRNGPIRELGSK